MTERYTALTRDETPPKWPGSPRSLLWIAALAVAVVFIVRDSDRLSAPFGPSHDGFNAALYMTGGRAILEDGLLVSRVGASSRTVSGDRVIYAHHPPLIYLADATSLALVGLTETAARLPAVGSSLVVLVLLVFVLAASGLPSGPAGIGLLFAFATPMFLMFGVMTEPHALGLAPMAALTLLWQRTRVGCEPHSGVLASAAAIATLTSWQAGLFAALVGLALFTARRRKAGIAILTGTAVSAILIGFWILWAYGGDLADFAERALHRLGAGNLGRVTFGRMISQQMLFFSDLFPVGGWLVVPLATFGLVDRRTRPLVAVSLGTVLGYALLFRNGAYDHSYWLYCILLPLSLSAGAAADAVARGLSNLSLPRLTPAALAITLAVVLGVATWQPSKELAQQRYATAMGAQARALRWPPAQRYAYHALGGHGPTDLMPWLLFYSRRQPFGVDGPQSVPPGEIVLRVVDGQLVTVQGEQTHEPESLEEPA